MIRFGIRGLETVLRARLALARLGVLAAALVVAGCATGPRPEAFNALLAQPYMLDSGDALRITVFEQPSLSETYTVDVAGMISMPLVGEIPARGLTTDELDQSITAALRNGFLRAPDVSVEVSTYRPVFVLGEVGDAGQFPYVAGMTARSAIAIAGGFTPRASRNGVKITRTINGRVHTGRIGLDEPIRPADVITVGERWL
ncbi:MAG: polysaccharide biosynthesis/export family protein [Pseudomonadota bacterium]